MEIENVRKGTKFLINAIPYRIEDTEFVKPGKGQALYKLKLRNLFDNSILNRTYRSGDKIDEVRTETYKGQYLYSQLKTSLFQIPMGKLSFQLKI